MTDLINLCQDLIRYPSITPHDGGCLDYIEEILTPLGFRCQHLTFQEDNTPPIDNLLATIGEGSPHLCFLGHTDVVPTGDLQAWSVDPFAAVIINDKLYGRGIADMKGGIACFITAWQELMHQQPQWSGQLSILLTGDEEGPAINGVRKVVPWLLANQITFDGCLVGEPSSENIVGDTIKIGRRGSLSGIITIEGSQGHTAYHHLANNPCHALNHYLNELITVPLDSGSDHFQPSTLQITSIDVGNQATNVIPQSLHVAFNARFNDHYSGESLIKTLEKRCQTAALTTQTTHHLHTRISGEPFYFPPHQFAHFLGEAVTAVTGRKPDFNTKGGTSDARFMKDICPVAELGLINQTIHKIDEHVSLESLFTLKDIYKRFLTSFFHIHV